LTKKRYATTLVQLGTRDIYGDVIKNPKQRAGRANTGIHPLPSPTSPLNREEGREEGGEGREEGGEGREEGGEGREEGGEGRANGEEIDKLLEVTRLKKIYVHSLIFN
jgi:hypothetical protein